MKYSQLKQSIKKLAQLGRGGKPLGRKGGPLKAGPGGKCECPKCGKEFEHKRGVPCMERKCPKCGVKLVRKDEK